jgi:hypothetical protein
MRSILTLIALASMKAFCQPPPQLCSIPLLNATAPGKPVPMPGLKPRAMPPPNTNPRKGANPPRVQDRISMVPPAPACQAPARRTRP